MDNDTNQDEMLDETMNETSDAALEEETDTPAKGGMAEDEVDDLDDEDDFDEDDGDEPADDEDELDEEDDLFDEEDDLDEDDEDLEEVGPKSEAEQEPADDTADGL